MDVNVVYTVVVIIAATLLGGVLISRIAGDSSAERRREPQLDPAPAPNAHR